MKFVGREHKHSDDCWCSALSLAIGKTYDEVYNSLSIYVIDNGLAHDISKGILLNAGYIAKDLSKENMTVDFLLNIVNHYDNEVVISTNDHIFYVHKGKIHDIKQFKYNEKFFEEYVYYVFLRNLNVKWVEQKGESK